MRKGRADRRHFQNEAERPKRREERRDRPDDRGRSIVYGLLPVLEALRADPKRLDKIAIAEGAREHRLHEVVELARHNGIVIDRVPRPFLDRTAGEGSNHQGIVAFTAAASYVSEDQILQEAGRDGLLVLLDGVEDPRNLGAVLRTAECAGVSGVFIPDRRAVGLTDTVAKSSAGAVEYVRVAKVRNLNQLIENLKARDIWVIGTSADAPVSYTEWDWRRPSALVLGAEGSGLHRLVAENCDLLVNIPMYGRIDSLNVSVAAGVILFEARRQRVSSSEFQVPSVKGEPEN